MSKQKPKLGRWDDKPLTTDSLDEVERFKKQALAYVELCKALYEAIESCPHGIPSGHLYAMVMDKMELEQYMSLISVLKETGRIEERFHLLTAVKGEVK